MRCLVVYYSRSGNTAHVVHKLWRALNDRGGAELFELRYSDKQRSLLRQFFDRVMPFRVSLGEVPIDVKDYDILCIGTPVWGGRPAPLVSMYISRCENVSGKRIIYLQVYGFQASAERSLQYVERIMDKKGPVEIIGINIHWFKARDEESVDRLIQQAVDKVT